MAHTPIGRERDAWSRRDLERSITEAELLLARGAERDPGLATKIDGWRTRLQEILAHAAATTVRVGIVGAVKSGKSTLANALLGQDVLPRGSGILTARITEVVRADSPYVDLEWKTLGELNTEFSVLLALLGHPGPWDLSREEHRRSAHDLLQGTESAVRPELAPLASLLRGYRAAAACLGGNPTRLEGPAFQEGVHLATADETALFLRRLRVGAAVPDLPDGLCLLDCQGGDAWNVAHWHDLDEALLTCHLLLYVVSSRVGLRKADFRLLDAVNRYGLIDLTRIVFNQDLGEVRDPAELRRVQDGVQARLRELGFQGQMWSFSCLHSLLRHRLLLDPDAVADNERRLVEIWDAAGGSLAAASQEAFQSFRQDLWDDVRSERDRMVLARCRADLRRIVLDAVENLGARVLDGRGLAQVARETEAVDRLLTSAQEELASLAARERDRVASVIAQDFQRRRGRQRRAWEERIRTLSASGGEFAGPRTLHNLWSQAKSIVGDTEPLRVNAVRNLALEARGRLSQQAAAIGERLAESLRSAVEAVSQPPDSRELSRGITVTRPIPLFRLASASGAHLEEDGPAAAGASAVRILRQTGRKLWQRLPRAPSVQTAGEALSRRYLMHQLRAAWARYLEDLRTECLLPHIDEAAAQLYALLAAWVVAQVHRGDPSPASNLLERLAEPGEGR